MTGATWASYLTSVILAPSITWAQYDQKENTNHPHRAELMDGKGWKYHLSTTEHSTNLHPSVIQVEKMHTSVCVCVQMSPSEEYMETFLIERPNSS